jgi:hypothetical protein
MIISYDSTHLRIESVVAVAVADRALNSLIAIKLSISYRCSLFSTGNDFWLTKLLYLVKFVHFLYKPLRYFLVNVFYQD